MDNTANWIDQDQPSNVLWCEESWSIVPGRFYRNEYMSMRYLGAPVLISYPADTACSNVRLTCPICGKEVDVPVSIDDGSISRVFFILGMVVFGIAALICLCGACYLYVETRPHNWGGIILGGAITTVFGCACWYSARAAYSRLVGKCWEACVLYSEDPRDERVWHHKVTSDKRWWKKAERTGQR